MIHWPDLDGARLNTYTCNGRITFGDSYTFVQGTNGYPGYSFIGDQLNYAYDAEMLLTDKIVQNQVCAARPKRG